MAFHPSVTGCQITRSESLFIPLKTSAAFQGSRIKTHSTFLKNGDAGETRDLSKNCAQFHTMLIK